MGSLQTSYLLTLRRFATEVKRRADARASAPAGSLTPSAKGILPLSRQDHMEQWNTAARQLVAYLPPRNGRVGEDTRFRMQERLRYGQAYPDAYKAMLVLSQAVERTGLDARLIDLVNYRVSQLNGCAFCLDMHSKDLRAKGETEQRLYMMSAWREAPHLYTTRERAALAWAEAVTRLEDKQVPNAVYDLARNEFSEAELTKLTLATVAINGWNRFNVAFHTPAGDYKPAMAG
jgi:AhpD family alkylhydroperoxidase